MKHTLRAVLVLLLLSPSAVMADERRRTLDVWPADAPGETGEIGDETVLEPRGDKPVRRVTNVTQPTITVYKPPKDKDTGAAVLICPGGGYHILAMDLEGEEVAEWLNSIGVTGVLLKYRVPRRENRPKHEAPLQDAQRAMSLVRSHAAEWQIDPERIGILRFSAGGHLSATAATNFDRRSYETIDEIDRVSCRPDFAVLIYPAYLTEDDRAELAPEIRVSEQSPPTFFAHAWDDRISPENSIAMSIALKRAGVRSELHVYSRGGHGFGLRPSNNPCSHWPKQCEAWMRVEGLLDQSKK